MRENNTQYKLWSENERPSFLSSFPGRRPVGGTNPSRVAGEARKNWRKSRERIKIRRGEKNKRKSINMFCNIHALVVVVIMVHKLSNTSEFYVESQVNHMFDKMGKKDHRRRTP